MEGDRASSCNGIFSLHADSLKHTQCNVSCLAAKPKATKTDYYVLKYRYKVAQVHNKTSTQSERTAPLQTVRRYKLDVDLPVTNSSNHPTIKMPTMHADALQSYSPDPADIHSHNPQQLVRSSALCTCTLLRPNKLGIPFDPPIRALAYSPGSHTIFVVHSVPRLQP
ncbi:hypothetical protein LZ30DRAFT_461185 [Colletotrichum cereale]|nr:hypothetical protein LZ30DRAFT_461185 [Colletotrichum cereale]